MNVIKPLIRTVLICSFVTTFLFSDAHGGRKIYVKNLKEICLMSSLAFASTHSQDEWEDIYDAGEFVNEVKKICPKMTFEYEKEWTESLYHFSYQYANDSESVPSC